MAVLCISLFFKMTLTRSFLSWNVCVYRYFSKSHLLGTLEIEMSVYIVVFQNQTYKKLLKLKCLCILLFFKIKVTRSFLNWNVCVYCCFSKSNLLEAFSIEMSVYIVFFRTYYNVFKWKCLCILLFFKITFTRNILSWNVFVYRCFSKSHLQEAF